MTAPAAPTTARSAGPALPLWAVLAGLAHYALLEGLAMVRTGGVFEYPLDDVYIHLEMARSIASGGYGVNPGEFASAASSPLYPLLLAPMAGWDLHVLVPAFINILALVGCAWAWAALIARTEFARFPRLAVALVVIGPIALNFAGIAVLGMEHALHALVSLLVLLGLIDMARGGEDARIGWLLPVGIVLGPLLRPEGLAISLAACAYLLVRGRRRAGLALAAGAVVPFLAFVILLLVLGIGPLPSSVVAKLPPLEAESLSRIEMAALAVLINVTEPIGKTMIAIMLAMGMGLAAAGRAARRRTAPIVVIALAAGAAHLVFGQMGWAFRYENYVLVFLVGAAIHVFADWTLSGRAAIPLIAPLVPAAILAVPLVFYFPQVLSAAPQSARVIYLQQRQMARFAQEYVQAPVAVNDIGWVAWRNPHYVLDLWGLASREALEARRSRVQDGWADRLAAHHGTDLAMVYDHWVRGEVGADWTRLGVLAFDGPSGFIDGANVAFYATRPEAVAPLRAQLDAFVPTLPKGAKFVYAEGAR